MTKVLMIVERVNSKAILYPFLTSLIVYNKRKRKKKKEKKNESEVKRRGQLYYYSLIVHRRYTTIYIYIYIYKCVLIVYDVW